MKINMPITELEHPLDAGRVIVSKTDLEGTITYVNRDFCEISGFTEAELVGRNHNVVRHPHMPPAVFQDLWDTVKAGRPWSGMVKNRCKNGDHYWVRANVTPLRSEGAVVGYLSVRTCASRAEIDAAEARYRAVRERRAPLEPVRWAARLDPLRRLKVWQRFALAFGLFALLAAGTWAVMARGLAEMNHGLRMAANDRRVSVAIGDAFQALTDARAQFLRAQVQGGDVAAEVARAVREDLERAREATAVILGADLTGDEQSSARDYGGAVQAYVERALEPAREALEAGDLFTAAVIAREPGAALAGDVESALAAFKKVQARVTAEEAANAKARFEETRRLSLLLLVSGAGAALLISLTVLIGFRRRIGLANGALAGIAEGRYFEWFEADGDDELGEMLAGLEAMQIRLGYEVMDAREKAASATRIRQALDHVSANVMVADPEHNIIYLNPAVQAMFEHAADDIRTELKDFEPAKLLGSNIDRFHEDPGRQRRLLEGLSGRHAWEFVLGGRTLRVVANPVRDESGERLGTAVEWLDRTAEVAVENEVSAIVDAARAGELGRRIALEGKTGFFRKLSEGINALVEVNGRVVEDVARVLAALAKGDLTQRIEADYRGAFEGLKRDANATIGKLTEVLGEIKATAGAVEVGAQELSAGNASLSQRTEEQASSLEETASSMEQMTATVKQNADNARQANELAGGAREQAERGGAVVGRAVAAMGELNASSKQIADIISVIDEIAFQTNLLALNAAVEAARAGEQGRGFAVVASEVRNLAQRSATAAKEIKELIGTSVEQVAGGTRLVDESGRALEEIVTAVKKVSDIVAEIAAASAEQSAGIEQVNRAVMQMDEMTQHNAALVEEAASASEAMGEKAEGLAELVGFFAVDGEVEGEVRGETEGAPAMVERRSARRPWTDPAPAAQPRAGARSAPRTAAAGGDDEWEEF